MSEHIKLLMEETGCDRGEAELALELSGHDIEKAIKTIGSILKYIHAIKGKFYFPNKNLYGLLLIVINAKTEAILRLRSVISHNPFIYETSMKIDWFDFEKLVFSYRLEDGSLPDFTKEFEDNLKIELSKQLQVLFSADAGKMSDIVKSQFPNDELNADFVKEELNLAQFRKLPDFDTASKYEQENEFDPGTVILDSEIIEEKSGKECSKLFQGDVVLSKITDSRDIAHYLAHLIGSSKDGELLPLAASVRKVKVNGTSSEVQISYGPNIVGIAKVNSNLRVKVLEEAEKSWWKKILKWEIS